MVSVVALRLVELERVLMLEREQVLERLPVLGLELELERSQELELGRFQVAEVRWQVQRRSWVVSAEVNNLLRHKVQ